MTSIVRTLATLAVASVGAFVMSFLDIPGGLLMGAALLVSIAAIAGFKATLPTWLRDVLFVCVGLTMGASVAPDTLTLIGQWPVTLAALAIEMAAIILACGFVLMKMFGLDKGTAYLSSFPGHLSFVMSIATAGAGDARQIVIIQVIRVMALTLCVPIGALFLPVGNYNGNTGEGPIEMTTLAMVALGCAIAGFSFKRLRMPAAYVLGSMAFATAMKLTGNFPGTLPPLLVNAIFVGMGALIGSRFAGITVREFLIAAKGGAVSTILAVAICTALAYGLTYMVDMPFGQLWLALSPGGLESMGALGIALGYDTAFIAAHHVARLMMLTFAIPTIVMLLKLRQPHPAPTNSPDPR